YGLRTGISFGNWSARRGTGARYQRSSAGRGGDQESRRQVLSKLRVNDMAGEFGISVDEVITLLRQMDVPVRSHVSPLTDDQVARIRARGDGEKRPRATAPPAAASRRRRGAAAPVVEAPPPVVEAA